MNYLSQILIIRIGAIGDTIALLPLIRCLRMNFPASHIELMGYTERLVLGVNSHYADKCVSFDSSEISSFFVKGTSLPQRLSNYFCQFDLILAFICDEEGIITENFKRIGVKKIIVMSSIPEAKSKKHITEYLFDAITPLEIQLKYNIPQIVISEENREFAKKFFTDNNLENYRVVAIHPGSGSYKKCWPIKKFVELAKMIVKDNGLKILLVSGSADKENIDFFMNSIDKNYFVLANELPLLQLAAVIERCDAFIGNDSGITHISAGVGISTIAIFGPTDPGIWAPRGKKVTILRGNESCIPCSDEQRRNCNLPKCLQGIQVDEVKRRLNYVINNMEIGS